MTNRLWANSHWEVADDGVASITTVEYFIPRHRLCELHDRYRGRCIAMWPIQIAEKSWAPIEPFLEAYQQALRLLRPNGVERIDLAASLAKAREEALRD
jgi:hypothetical protein